MSSGSSGSIRRGVQTAPRASHVGAVAAAAAAARTAPRESLAPPTRRPQLPPSSQPLPLPLACARLRRAEADVAACAALLAALEAAPHLKLSRHVDALLARQRALIAVEAVAQRGMDVLSREQALLARTIDEVNQRQALLARLAAVEALRGDSMRAAAVEQGHVRLAVWRGIVLDAARHPSQWQL